MAVGGKSMTFPRLTDLRKALFFAACGGLGGAAGSLLVEPLQRTVERRGEAANFEEVMLQSTIWFALIGGGIAAAILLGQGRYLRRGLRFDRCVVIGMVFGLIAGAVSGAIAQFIFSAGGEGELLRAICWGIAGGLLGLSLSARIPNLVWRRGLIGGFIGGFIGGILFIAFTFGVGNPTLGRLAGVYAIGFLIGLMIILADALFREAWLEVAYGQREERAVTLGAEPVILGSDSSCTVYVAGAPAQAYSYRLEQGRIICEDLVTSQTSMVRPGDSRSLGKVALTVRAASPLASSAGFSAYSQKPPRRSRRQASAGESASPMASSALNLWVSPSQRIPLVLGRTLNAQDLPQLSAAGDNKAQPLGVVASNPADPSILGLKNLSSLTWEVSLPAGAIRNVEPGQTVKLVPGTGITFGSVKAEIR
jgi:Ca-activated chloride channel family protein